jgi:hypothetical protein
MRGRVRFAAGDRACPGGELPSWLGRRLRGVDDDEDELVGPRQPQLLASHFFDLVGIAAEADDLLPELGILALERLDLRLKTPQMSGEGVEFQKPTIADHRQQAQQEETREPTPDDQPMPSLLQQGP